MTRVEKSARARELREQGMLLREIAVAMGVAVQTVHAWLDDPDGSKLRARKDSYRGECILCGGPTDGSRGPGKAPELCQECRSWPEAKVVVAMREWADEHGGIPPTCTEWKHADTDHPAADGVCRRIGWNNALLKAGFALRCDRRPETQRWVIDQLRAGVTFEEIGDALGVTPEAIRMRLRWRGLTLAGVLSGVAA